MGGRSQTQDIKGLLDRVYFLKPVIVWLDINIQ